MWITQIRATRSQNSQIRNPKPPFSAKAVLVSASFESGHVQAFDHIAQKPCSADANFATLHLCLRSTKNRPAATSCGTTHGRASVTHSKYAPPHWQPPHATPIRLPSAITPRRNCWAPPFPSAPGSMRTRRMSRSKPRGGRARKTSFPEYGPIRTPRAQPSRCMGSYAPPPRRCSPRWPKSCPSKTS